MILSELEGQGTIAEVNQYDLGVDESKLEIKLELPWAI